MNMRFFTFLSAIFVLLASPVLGTSARFEEYKGQVKTNSYIIKLKSNVTKEDCLDWLTPYLESNALTHTGWEREVFHGFAGQFSDDVLTLLRSSPNIESVSEDGIMSINSAVTQTNAPWGIARISQDATLATQVASNLNFTYTYDSTAGAGVDVYVIDTGINTAHTQFEGRATWGQTFGGYADADGNGHGTHVAGTVGSRRFGVAKKANLIAVKVLSDSGSGSVSDIVSGLNFVLSSVRASGRPSIATMSLGGSVSTALDNAVASLTNAGIHVTVAAGNENSDAATSSPARAPSAITVGAITIADARASFSNFGSLVDVFAPGQGIVSTWIGSRTATNTLSGTSMATPHVAGLVAYLIGHDGNITPAAMAAQIKSLSITGAISRLPSGTTNSIARNDEA